MSIITLHINKILYITKGRDGQTRINKNAQLYVA